MSRPAPVRNSDAAGVPLHGIADESGAFHDCATIDIEAFCLPLDAGDEFVLIDADASSAIRSDEQGDLLAIDVCDDTLLARMEDKSRVGEGGAALDPGCEAFPECGLAQLDLEGDSAIEPDTAVPPDVTEADQDEDFFAALGDGRSRRESGSRIGGDRRLIAGFTGRTRFGTNRFTTGAGDRDIHSRFTRTVKVRSRGDTRYTGSGLLARLLDLGDTSDARAYAEASARAGREKIFYGRNLKNAAGRGARYDTHATYIGLRLGVGRVWNIRDRNSFAFYGKYLYAHLGSDSVRLGTGDPVKFDTIESQRLRFGGRYSWMLGNDTNPYLGLTWEREFDGRTTARSYGLPLDAPNVRGNTGIVEFGLSLCPTLGSPLSIELDVRGYGGEREGISGGLRMEYRF
ncbi:MAG: autotransporter outer membrane beta-barrel domain-containing protein [Candidatus Accumulibacter sp.]|nr:autotransporter outer membrane beta-barrel domain-containing protein [Accumulibacter sp.]